jgi:hypothetical protein
MKSKSDICQRCHALYNAETKSGIDSDAYKQIEVILFSGTMTAYLTNDRVVNSAVNAASSLGAFLRPGDVLPALRELDDWILRVSAER